MLELNNEKTFRAHSGEGTDKVQGSVNYSELGEHAVIGFGFKVPSLYPLVSDSDKSGSYVAGVTNNPRTANNLAQTLRWMADRIEDCLDYREFSGPLDM